MKGDQDQTEQDTRNQHQGQNANLERGLAVHVETTRDFSGSNKTRFLQSSSNSGQLQAQLVRAAAVERSAMEVAQHLQKQLALAKRQKEQLEQQLGDAKAGSRYNGAGSSDIPQRKTEDLQRRFSKLQE